MKNSVMRARIESALKANVDREPSMAELQVLKRQSQERDHRIDNSADVSKGQMLLLSPQRLRGAKVRWPKASMV